MFKKFIANLERPYEGPPSRSVWVGFAMFCAILLCNELVQLSRGKGDAPEIAILAAFLAMTVFLLSRHRLIRLVSCALFVLLFITSVAVHAAKWFR
jgi:hypothetical protein